MTIKEIEVCSGMTRANIRFYESEGFISPVRVSNGYRDYSEEDLNILLRVKLLRTLHMSLEEIKAVHNGEKELWDALKRHAGQLTCEKEGIEQAQSVCKKMQADGVHYDTLDAEKYLSVMHEKENAIVRELQTDVLKEEAAPFRRFFARSMDFTIYNILWLCILSFLNINVNNRAVVWNLVDTAVVLVLTFLMEPILLSKIGTTPGKWILGIRVTGLDGGNLSYEAAGKRTFEVLNWGVGFKLPLYGWYRLYKSFEGCAKEQTLEWEYRSRLIYRDWKAYRIVMYLGVHLVLFAALLVSMFQAAQVPKHRGNITVAQFCENYNHFLEYYDLDEIHGLLDETGNWTEAEQSGAVMVIHDTLGKPEFVFEEEDGYLTGVQFRQSHYNENDIPAYQRSMVIAIQSFAGASEEFGIFTNELDDISVYIKEHPYESFEFTVYGMTITCEVSLNKDVENAYIIAFAIRK